MKTSFANLNTNVRKLYLTSLHITGNIVFLPSFEPTNVQINYEKD
jgi:hypothetical protein